MKKGSVFANRKGPLAAGFGTPSNASASAASNSFFDNSLPHVPRNWQATPMNSHRFPPTHYLPTVNSTSSIRALAAQTPSSNLINRVKPHTLQHLVENLNELLAELAIPHTIRYESKYGFEDILTVLDHLTYPNRYVDHRFQPFPPLPQPTKAGGKISLTDRWAYLKQILMIYRLATLDQLTRIKPERTMANDQVMIMFEMLTQLATCLLKSQQEQERICSHHYLNEFKILMRQMFWIGRHDPSVMEESMLELKHHIYAKDKLQVVDRSQHEKEIKEKTIERDHLRKQSEELKKLRDDLEIQCTQLTTSNENEITEFTKKQEEYGEEQEKLNELTQIVEQKELDKKHLTDRNQTLSDKLFSQQTDVELQRHLRTNTELKQQHEVLLSTLLLEQQLHSTGGNEHKRLVKELQETLGKYQILLSAYKHKSCRAPPTSVDFDLSDIIGDTTSNITNDSVRQAQISIENLTKETTSEEIFLTQRFRDFEQESKKKIEELQLAEREWKTAAKNGQKRAAQQNELSRFQQEIRILTTKIADFERRIEEKKNSTVEMKKQFEQMKNSIVEILLRFETLEKNYSDKEEKLRDELNNFLFDQNLLAKSFRRDVEELKRSQQEHLSKLEINSKPLSFDELVQEQIVKLYHFRQFDDDEEDEEEENLFSTNEFDKIHDEHSNWTKKKKKDAKTNGILLERYHELHDKLNLLNVGK